jgi:hypothetical protein
MLLIGGSSSSSFVCKLMLALSRRRFLFSCRRPIWLTGFPQIILLVLIVRVKSSSVLSVDSLSALTLGFSSKNVCKAALVARQLRLSLPFRRLALQVFSLKSGNSRSRSINYVLSYLVVISPGSPSIKTSRHARHLFVRGRCRIMVAILCNLVGLTGLNSRNVNIYTACLVRSPRTLINSVPVLSPARFVARQALMAARLLLLLLLPVIARLANFDARLCLCFFKDFENF